MSNNCGSFVGGYTNADFISCVKCNLKYEPYRIKRKKPFEGWCDVCLKPYDLSKAKIVKLDEGIYK